jgi:hypothetical protein
MKSNAPGQLLGFALQFPRALYHLLKSGPGDSVCVEVLGDVATLSKDGSVTSEEDKSSIVGNPLTDRSTNLWKTFYNWIFAVQGGDLIVEKTRFILYCNQSGKAGIVNSFGSAQNSIEAAAAIDNAKKVLHDVPDTHDIWKYYDFAVNQNGQILQVIIERFELQTSDGAGYEEIRHEFRCKLVAETQIDFLMEKISGWLLRTVSECIAAKNPAIIKWEDFDHEFKLVFERSRRRELYDFTLVSPPGAPEIKQQIKIRPCYLKQLEAIDSSDDEMIEAVTDYLRAKVNLEKWIEDELIDYDTAKDFELKLLAFWSNKKKQISITQNKLPEEEQGQLLLSECKSRQETISNMSPVRSSIEGTYHSLANKPELGWHPKWEQLFSIHEEN